MFEYTLLTASNSRQLEDDITQLADDGWRVQAVHPPTGLFGSASKWHATMERNRVRLQWKPWLENDIVGYRIYWSLEGATAGGTLATLPPSVTAYVVDPTFFNSGLTYLLSVAAYDVAGNESIKTVLARVTG
jgi:hypothetical protein